jgi:hypothetical protein
MSTETPFATIRVPIEDQAEARNGIFDGIESANQGNKAL